jgi:hypothetical protein
MKNKFNFFSWHIYAYIIIQLSILSLDFYHIIDYKWYILFIPTYVCIGCITCILYIMKKLHKTYNDFDTDLN